MHSKCLLYVFCILRYCNHVVNFHFTVQLPLSFSRLCFALFFFVLRLRSDYAAPKIQENIQAEIMQVVLEEAHDSYQPHIIMVSVQTVFRRLLVLIFVFLGASERHT